MDTSEREQPVAIPLPSSAPRPIVVALLGNPNTGKTTLFNALAGMRQRVGNYPGVTVEIKKGRLSVGGLTLELVDLPGTYSLAARSPDEMVAVDLILGQQGGEPRPDVIVSIVDASNLERNLYLTTQAIESEVPIVVALNMIDLAEKQGVTVDHERLARRIGIRVVPIQANKGRGLEMLKQSIIDTAKIASRPHEFGCEPLDKNGQSNGGCKSPCFPEAFEHEASALAKALGNGFAPFLARRLLLDVGGYTEERLTRRKGESVAELVKAARERLASAGAKVPEVEARARYAWIRQATSGCVERPAQRTVHWTDRLDRLLTHRILGTLIFFFVMFVVFEAIFTGARPLMDGIDFAREWLGNAVGAWMAPGPLQGLVRDGVIKGVGSVLVFLPQILILFGFIAVLEDCGYMARAAFLMDRLMGRCGLSGKSFIPMLSSVACAVPGIMATRVIENRRDRLTTILVAPLMSCSARLPVYTLLIGAFLTTGYAWWVPGLVMFGMYAIGLVVAPLVALALKRTLLRGETPVFVMEMPLYKWPSAGTVVRRMTDAGVAFLRRAGTLILASMIVVWALLYFPHVDGQGVDYESRVSRLEIERGPDADDAINRLEAEWKSRSYLGQLGRTVEPAVRPLGWDWRVGMAVLASFPAREVIVGTLGIIYNAGRIDSDDVRNALDQEAAAKAGRLKSALREAAWDGEPARKVFTVPTALSVMVFFALCCQCASTLAVIRRETNSWLWPLFTFSYMTLLAYLGALVVYQVGTRLFA